MTGLLITLCLNYIPLNYYELLSLRFQQFQILGILDIPEIFLPGLLECLK